MVLWNVGIKWLSAVQLPLNHSSLADTLEKTHNIQKRILNTFVERLETEDLQDNKICTVLCVFATDFVLRKGLL